MCQTPVIDELDFFIVHIGFNGTSRENFKIVRECIEFDVTAPFHSELCLFFINSWPDIIYPAGTKTYSRFTRAPMTITAKTAGPATSVFGGVFSPG